MKNNKNNSNSNNKNKFNRNRSFGGSGSSGGPASPTKKKSGRGHQPARRSISHDPQKLKEEFIPDDDGFTAISKRKGGNSNNITPRGRTNPTSSFSRPRNTQSFNKPRPTGSFKKGRDNRNHPQKLSSGKSFDGVPNNNNGNNNNNRRHNSFHKPRPTGSFNAKNNRNNYNNDNAVVIPSPNNNAAAAAAKRELYRRSTSRLTADDVELYTQGDGKSPAQRRVVRLHVDVLMRARLSNLDPPSFGENSGSGDTWNPHHKCLWNDPTRRDQIDTVMQQYPNAIPLHLKKRTRIKSSRLGDTTTPSAASSVVSVDTNDNDNSERDDSSSLGTSIRSISEQPSQTNETVFDEEDMNPLRKTLLLLNKLSWTTIDKLTPKLFQVLEEDVPKVMTMMPGGATTAPPTTVVTPTSEADESETTATNDNNNNKTASPAAPSPQASADVPPMVMTILTMIVEKSQTEPHFSAMYAQLCKNLAERNTAWKRKILAHCQSEFEHDTAWHIARLDERLEAKAASNAVMEDVSSSTNATEDMDRDYQVLQLRKKYKGHVQFLGELFKLKLIKLDIMIWCLSRLLFHKEQPDEDDLECFAKLMTVVGEQAESLVKKGKCHAMAEEKWYQCWDHIYLLTGRTKKSSSKQPQQQSQQQSPEDQQQPATPTPPKISSRIKFMLVDLLELEENDWVHRRQHEKAKTIAEIHEEVREEEAAALRRSYSDDWGNSSSSFGGGNRRRVSSDDYGMSPSYDSKPQKPTADADGFTEIPKRKSFMRRAVSDVEVSDLYNKRQQPNTKKKKQFTPVPSSPASRSKTVISQIDVSNATPKIVEYPDPQECKDKTKTILKEYFIGGDTNDAILSIDELIGAGRDNEDHGSVERGAAVIEAGVLLVMEMKQQDVQKFLAVIKRCLQKKKIEKASLALGLKDPLEFLSDIEIDAPLARSLLTSIVAYWIRQDVLSFNFLLEAPEYFRTDGKPAEFAAGVLRMRGGDVSDEDMAVVEKLMTEDDKKKYSCAKEMLAPQD